MLIQSLNPEGVGNFTLFQVEMESYSAVFHKMMSKTSKVGFVFLWVFFTFFILCSGLWVFKYVPSLIYLH